jgi:hypothetical protein
MVLFVVRKRVAEWDKVIKFLHGRKHSFLVNYTSTCSWVGMFLIHWAHSCNVLVAKKVCKENVVIHF